MTMKTRFARDDNGGPWILYQRAGFDFALGFDRDGFTWTAMVTDGKIRMHGKMIKLTEVQEREP